VIVANHNLEKLTVWALVRLGMAIPAASIEREVNFIVYV
jgi:hypothetical protein